MALEVDSLENEQMHLEVVYLEMMADMKDIRCQILRKRNIVGLKNIVGVKAMIAKGCCVTIFVANLTLNTSMTNMSTSTSTTRPH